MLLTKFEKINMLGIVKINAVTHSPKSLLYINGPLY